MYAASRRTNPTMIEAEGPVDGSTLRFKANIQYFANEILYSFLIEILFDDLSRI